MENNFGKFTSLDELLKAYKSLEKEFTRRCQRLSELEKALPAHVNPLTDPKNKGAVLPPAALHVFQTESEHSDNTENESVCTQQSNEVFFEDACNSIDGTGVSDNPVKDEVFLASLNAYLEESGDSISTPIAESVGGTINETVALPETTQPASASDVSGKVNEPNTVAVNPRTAEEVNAKAVYSETSGDNHKINTKVNNEISLTSPQKKEGQFNVSKVELKQLLYEALNDYIDRAQSPRLIGGGGIPPFAPPKKPTTLKEAAKLSGQIFGKSSD